MESTRWIFQFNSEPKKEVRGLIIQKYNELNEEKFSKRYMYLSILYPNEQIFNCVFHIINLQQLTSIKE